MLYIDTDLDCKIDTAIRHLDKDEFILFCHWMVSSSFKRKYFSAILP